MKGQVKAVMALNEEQVKRYGEDGYLIVEDFFTAEECDRLRQRAHEIIDETDFSSHPLVAFDTKDNSQMEFDYFITSGDKARFFLEKKAFDENGRLSVPYDKAVNKIGHALHAVDPLFKDLTHSERVKGIAKSLGLKKPAIVQSMVIFKQANLGGEVNSHQDSTYLYTTPMNLLGFWIALEDADTENGCLWFAPGSQGMGLPARMMRKTENGVLKIQLDGEQITLKPEEYVPASVKKGSLVLIQGEVVHKSELNTSERSRNVYTFHLYDTGTSEWSEKNWIQPTKELPFQLLY